MFKETRLASWFPNSCNPASQGLVCSLPAGVWGLQLQFLGLEFPSSVAYAGPSRLPACARLVLVLQLTEVFPSLVYRGFLKHSALDEPREKHSI